MERLNYKAINIDLFYTPLCFV